MDGRPHARCTASPLALGTARRRMQRDGRRRRRCDWMARAVATQGRLARRTHDLARGLITVRTSPPSVADARGRALALLCSACHPILPSVRRCSAALLPLVCLTRFCRCSAEFCHNTFKSFMLSKRVRPRPLRPRSRAAAPRRSPPPSPSTPGTNTRTR